MQRDACYFTTSLFPLKISDFRENWVVDVVALAVRGRAPNTRRMRQITSEPIVVLKEYTSMERQFSSMA